MTTRASENDAGSSGTIAPTNSMLNDRFVEYGVRLASDDITAVGVRAERAGFDLWAATFTALFFVAGLVMMMKVHDATGWLIGTGLVLTSAALGLSAKKWRYCLIVTSASGDVQVGMPHDPSELEALQRLIEGRMSGAQS